MMPLPDLTYAGFLPEGIHDGTLKEVLERFSFNPTRVQLAEKLGEFVSQASRRGTFSFAYVDGGFISAKAQPQDVDVILHTRAPWGAVALEAMSPYFQEGLDRIFQQYQVHLHFWSEGFPGGISDFRLFFQYLRPQDAAPLGLREDHRKGIVRVTL